MEIIIINHNDGMAHILWPPWESTGSSHVTISCLLVSSPPACDLEIDLSVPSWGKSQFLKSEGKMGEERGGFVGGAMNDDAQVNPWRDKELEHRSRTLQMHFFYMISCISNFRWSNFPPFIVCIAPQCLFLLEAVTLTPLFLYTEKKRNQVCTKM